MKKKCLFFIITIMVSLLSCTTTRSFDDVITMLIGNNNLKYYIRPSKMISQNYSEDKAYTVIDFSYQMKNREYVSDAYTNFTLNYEKVDFIKKVEFIILDSDNIILTNISTLDRDVTKNYIRVTTLLDKKEVKKVLTSIAENKAKLKLELENREILEFIPTKELINKVKLAFNR